MSILTQLSAARELLQLPNAKQLLVATLAVLGATAGLFALQQVAGWIVEIRFSRGSISFPFALTESATAGSPLSLVGWGFLVNAEPEASSIIDLLTYVVLCLLSCRLLAGTPLVVLAGIGANELEIHLTGVVLDWIILPNGGDAVRGLSLGDVCIYAGVLAMSVATLRLAVRSVHGAMEELRRVRS